MNDVQFVEAARVLAGAAMETVPGFDAASTSFRYAFWRAHWAEERRIARKSFDKFQQYYAAHPKTPRASSTRRS
jgi:hypothetical protein